MCVLNVIGQQQERKHCEKCSDFDEKLVIGATKYFTAIEMECCSDFNDKAMKTGLFFIDYCAVCLK